MKYGAFITFVFMSEGNDEYKQAPQGGLIMVNARMDGIANPL
jgi:hypothetical protein